MPRDEDRLAGKGPIEPLRAALRISPENAAKVREEAAEAAKGKD